MKKQFTFLTFLLIAMSAKNIFGQLQSTWVKTFRYEQGSMHPAVSDTLNLGPRKIVELQNGKLFVLNDQIDDDQYLYLIDSLGHISVSRLVGYSGLSIYRSAFGLAAVPGNGCAYIEQLIQFSTYPEYTLFNVSSSGTSTQIYHWATPPGSPDYTRVYSILPNYHNGYYCNVNDTFVDIPSNTIIPGNLLYVFSNDDYLTDDQDLQRKDVSGSVLWTYALNNYDVIASGENAIYLTNDSLRKVDANSGQLLWTRALPATGTFEIMKSTSGLVVLDDRTISVIDSSGNVSDTNYISLTMNSPTTIATALDGSIYTGGEFRTQTIIQSRNYSTFLIKLDQEAKGVVDSTTFYLAGDADHDSHVSFIKDGLFMAAAIGKSTPLNQLNSNLQAIFTTYSELWPDSSECGINYSFSDADLNGRIETRDIEFINYPTETWFTQSTNDTSGSIIKIVLDNNVLSPLDTVYATVIVGSQGLPTDSFYGISLEPLMAFAGFFGAPNIAEVRTDALGDTTSNLIYVESPYPLSNPYLGMILCRTDHQQISLAGDTIARIKKLVSQYALAGTYTVNNSCFMIDKEGCFMPVNIISDTFNIVVNSIRGYSSDPNLKVYPNPASTTLNISSGENSGKEIVIKNILGEIVFRSEFPGKNISVQTEYWSNGIYFLETISAKTRDRIKVIVEH